ncbi:MAG: hypothetical protein ACE5JD_16690 [Candidatus Methylomirabilia bacterium]
MNSSRVPRWLKMGFTGWVAAWVPFYWAYYGPQNFLWFCDIGNFVIATALWTESRLLFSWQAVSLLLVQTAYSIDLMWRLVLGFHLFGGTEYMFNPAIPLGIRLLSLFHVANPPLLVWGLWRLGYDRRGWIFQTVTAWVVLPACFFFFGPDKDINWVWGPFDKLQHVLPPGLYFSACMIGYPLLVYLPSHLLLSLLSRRFRSASGREQPQRTV